LSHRWSGKETIFGKKEWSEKDEKSSCKSRRGWTFNQFQFFVDKFEWNNHGVPIVPLIHATEYSSAKNIVEVGFASLSKLDKGFYGKGIYFTNSTDYSIVYIIHAKKPCLIISYVLPGNPYPVIENPSENTFLGAPIMASYDSHVICVGPNGFPKKVFGLSFLEVVLDQEARVLPAFLVSLQDIKIQFSEEENKEPSGTDSSSDDVIELKNLNYKASPRRISVSKIHVTPRKLSVTKY